MLDRDMVLRRLIRFDMADVRMIILSFSRETIGAMCFAADS